MTKPFHKKNVKPKKRVILKPRKYRRSSIPERNQRLLIYFLQKGQRKKRALNAREKKLVKAALKALTLKIESEYGSGADFLEHRFDPDVSRLLREDIRDNYSAGMKKSHPDSDIIFTPRRFQISSKYLAT
ncbi:hypothetical protein A2Z53_01625 [Candidatus Giovannonibacteria bacterium RIFCSPHIGHO2_02_42_15]|uniref:Uncharacterized protein n=2 Tax=Candidatus Giovannoniibacteriota TaxID=1752738 RepID=A0A1F5VQG1_9BACT|nr:MAG: hypothetical protein UV11_C0011G0029 [Candidatus Giovannonibacteria bacterium GW2011_GWF2_42_19]OGF65301.1 MAG: hypothetical protein A2Z53_01625 [Candidatus Giovannonibacteria bacterium RIFCSPHIGHO2_02_42_15]